MNTGFQIRGLDRSRFAGYFAMDDEALNRHRAAWVEVDAQPGYPCRVSLQDAAIGERVLALPFCHHEVDSPYYAAGPIFVREAAANVELAPNTIPDMLLHRTLSVRGYGQDQRMQSAEVISGTELHRLLGQLFNDEHIDYVHIHNAGPGCFNCEAVRVGVTEEQN